MKRLTFLLSIVLLTALSGRAQMDVEFHNESADTTRLAQLLDAAAAANLPTPEERVAFFGKAFLGTPYVAHTLEGDEEVLRINTEELDCTTFVESCLALAMTIGENRHSWRDYVYNLRRIRYRNGEVNGYPSRLHYIADWAVDNRHRGNFRDVTEDFPRINYIVRSLDFMTSHRDAYPALADSANFARMKSVESGYRNHRFPYLKSSELMSKGTRKLLRNGDVVALVSTIKNLDVTHMGMIYKETPDSEPYLLHASMSGGKVLVSSTPLTEFMKKNRQFMGIRVFRLYE